MGASSCGRRAHCVDGACNSDRRWVGGVLTATAPAIRPAGDSASVNRLLTTDFRALSRHLACGMPPQTPEFGPYPAILLPCRNTRFRSGLRRRAAGSLRLNAQDRRVWSSSAEAFAAAATRVLIQIVLLDPNARSCGNSVTIHRLRRPGWRRNAKTKLMEIVT